MATVTSARDGSANGRRARTVAAALAIAVTLSACSGSSAGGPPDEIGQLRATDAGVAITVPALWASARGDGTYDGGIEPTEVIVSTASPATGYRVDLSSIEAKGAGPAWEAATASAAAFATLFSGTEPSRVSLTFTITGPIDGPSAGGLLACGLLAAFSGVPFRPGVTMTGTITPDGSIGIVGYIPRKVQAAADAGYRTVIIPAEALREPVVLPDGRTLEEYASARDVTLVPVRTVGEAYATLTGRPSFYPEAPPATLTAATSIVARGVTEQAVARLRARVTAASPALDPYAVDLARRALAGAEGALEAGDTGLAYGQAAFGSDRLARATGAARVEATTASEGLAGAQSLLVADARALIAAADDAIARLRQLPVPSIEAQSSLPTLLSWPVFATASAVGILDQVPRTTDPALLQEMGRVLATQLLAVQEGLGDAERILAASPAAPPSTNAVSELLAYGDFFEEAARANATYARDVLRRGPEVDDGFDDQGVSASIAAIARYLASPEATPTGPIDIAEAATRTAVSMTALWLTAALVANAQAYGRGDAVAIDSRRAFAPEAQQAAVIGASGTVDSVVALLAEQDVRPDLPIWSTRWSTALSEAYRGTADETEANWLAQEALWYDVMQTVMLRAMAATP